MDSPTYVSLYTGGGGLDLAFGRAMPGARAVCVVEHEASAAALIVDHMQAGLMDDCPVWTDALTFDGRPWRGAVDWLIGGPPCQPFSVAGKRLAADDPRNLWPATLRMVAEIQPVGCFFENVPSADSLWYVYSEVIPGLSALGYEVEAGIFSAAEVGAPHQRERIFILAYSEERRGGALRQTNGLRPSSDSDHGSEYVAHARHDAGSPEQRQQPGEWPEVAGRGNGDVADTNGRGRWPQGDGELSPARTHRAERPMEWPPGPSDTDAWAAVLAERPDLAPAVGHAESDSEWRERQSRTAEGSIPPRGSISANHGQETPQPEIRDVADGLAGELAGLSRAQRLRLLGNGVVPATAEHAFRVLSERLGI